MLVVEEYRRESGIPIIRTFIALPVAGSPVEAVRAMIGDMEEAGVDFSNLLGMKFIFVPKSS